jgi:hypothetical protein
MILPLMMKPCQTLSKESTQAKKETKDKDQSPGKQTAQKRRATRRKEREPLRTEPSTQLHEALRLP